MFVQNEDYSIYVTRGDSCDIVVDHSLKIGDVVRFKVTRKKDCNTVMLQRDFVADKANTITIHLDGAETKLGEVISKPTDYWYEVELNPDTDPKTILGYDEEGAKILRLYPEGKDVDGDDIQVVGAKTLQELVDYALAEAKASGEFKGDPGHTPIKGADYWTEEDIEEIKSGLNETVLGDIETALDTIIAIQEELINNGGGSGEDEGSYCPNCGEFTGEGPCPNNCYELEQTFYVDGEYYTYYSGMTWEDFINSGYNKTVTCSDCGSKNKLAYTDGDSVYFLIGACCGIGHVTLYYDENHEIPVHLTAGIVGEHSYYY